MIVLGLDPGKVSGYGIIHDGKLIEAGTLVAGPRRFVDLHDQLIELLDAHKVNLAAVEAVQFHPARPGACVPLAEMRGALLLALERRRITTVSMAANEWKLALYGRGTAKKSDVQRILSGLLGRDLSGQRLDTSDAIAIAYTAWLRNRGRIAA